MSTKTEKPILFSGEMVRAILDGRKTQTRRVVKPQPWDEALHTAGGCGWAWAKSGPGATQFDWNTTPVALAAQITKYCPYGLPGTRLWVRETWQCDPVNHRTLCYRATGHGSDCKIPTHLWRPSIHMPRWASRITLEVAAVRVERLQEITEEDAKAEGTDEDKFAVHYYCDEGDPDDPNDFGTHRCNWRFGFKMLWESIYGPESWDTNPWVWVIEFTRIER